MKTRYLVCLALLLALSPLTHADIVVLGLFKGAALIKADGQQKLLKVGQTWRGVTLIEANAKEGVADYNGERITLKVSGHISTNYAKPATRQVVIRKNENHQYITTASINGRSTQVLVDTGANIVAMNSAQARALGVDISKGERSQVTTASGQAYAHRVMLDTVNVGGIEVPHIQATVIDGNHPEMVLLGVSFLQHVQMTEKDGILMLTSKF